MAKTSTTTQGLRAAIERSGYYPALVAEAVEAAIGGDTIRSYLVHQETTFDANEVRRHVTVLVLTGNRFIVSHTDEQNADTTSPTPYATTSTESVKLGRISSVVVSRVVANPESYTPGALPRGRPDHRLGRGLPHRPGARGLRRPGACEASHGLHGQLDGGRPEPPRQRGRGRPGGDGAPGPRLRAVPLRGDRGHHPLMALPTWDHPEPLAIDSRAPSEYGAGSLADLLPTLAAGMGVPGMNTAIPELTEADRNCVFLIDGLGWENMKAHPGRGPLHELPPRKLRGGTGRPITAGYPATTASSLASVGTGLPPGAHGLPGYTMRNPEAGELMNQLRWSPWTEPRAWQPYPTVFQLADAAGVHTAQVSSRPSRTPRSPKIALSGGTFHGRLSGEEARMDLAAEQLAAQATARWCTPTTPRWTARATASASTRTPGAAS